MHTDLTFDVLSQSQVGAFCRYLIRITIVPVACCHSWWWWWRCVYVCVCAYPNKWYEILILMFILLLLELHCKWKMIRMLNMYVLQCNLIVWLIDFVSFIRVQFSSQCLAVFGQENCHTKPTTTATPTKEMQFNLVSDERLKEYVRERETCTWNKLATCNEIVANRIEWNHIASKRLISDQGVRSLRSWPFLEWESKEFNKNVSYCTVFTLVQYTVTVSMLLLLLYLMFVVVRCWCCCCCNNQ